MQFFPKKYFLNGNQFSDEFELEFSGSSQAVKVPSRAELGHSNFRAETKLTIWKQIS
jgi:hypothetical protein